MTTHTVPPLEHVDQHIEAIRPTVKVKEEVTASIFDDKVREMGTITVSNGKILIYLHSPAHLTTDEHTRDFTIASIALGLKACWDANSKPFTN